MEERILNAAQAAYERAEDSSAKRVPWHCLADHWKAYWITIARTVAGSLNKQ